MIMSNMVCHHDGSVARQPEIRQQKRIDLSLFQHCCEVGEANTAAGVTDKAVTALAVHPRHWLRFVVAVVNGAGEEALNNSAGGLVFVG